MIHSVSMSKRDDSEKAKEQEKPKSVASRFRINTKRKSVLIPTSDMNTPSNCSQINLNPKSSSNKATPHMTLHHSGVKDPAEASHVYTGHGSEKLVQEIQKERFLIRQSTEPGVLNKQTRFTKRYDTVTDSDTKEIEVEKFKRKIKIRPDIYDRFYSRWKEFKKMPKYDLDKPSVSISGPYLADKGTRKIFILIMVY